jgi:hypothetical protein
MLIIAVCGPRSKGLRDALTKVVHTKIMVVSGLVFILAGKEACNEGKIEAKLRLSHV